MIAALGRQRQVLSKLRAILDHRMLSGKNVYMTSLAPFKVIVQEGKIIDRNTSRSVELSSDAGRWEDVGSA